MDKYCRYISNELNKNSMILYRVFVSRVDGQDMYEIVFVIDGKLNQLFFTFSKNKKLKEIVKIIKNNIMLYMKKYERGV